MTGSWFLLFTCTGGQDDLDKTSSLFVIVILVHVYIAGRVQTRLAGNCCLWFYRSQLVNVLLEECRAWDHQLLMIVAHAQYACGQEQRTDQNWPVLLWCVANSLQGAKLRILHVFFNLFPQPLLFCVFSIFVNTAWVNWLHFLKLFVCGSGIYVY